MRTNEVFKQLESLLINQSSILNIVDEVQALRLTITEDDILSEFVNTVRGIVQREAKWAVIDAGGRGFVAMATGSGKSKVAIDLASYYTSDYFQWQGTTLFVPTEKLRDENWKEEFVKWGKEELYNKLDRICYASASKVEDKNPRLVILDEAHNMTELAYNYFVNNDVENIVALSATVPTDDVKKDIFRKLGLPLVYNLTLDDAVKLGFVAPYKITIVFTELDAVNKNVKAGNKANPFFQTEEQNYAYLTKMYDAGRNLAAITRMRFIANLKSKTEAAKYIKNHVMPVDDRKLLFCGSIVQAEELSVSVYHSKTDSYFFDQFKSGLVNELACVQALNEGHNFIGLDSALITQITSKEKNLIQRIGRMIRFRPGHEAHIWLLICKGTQDENWLASATENLDKSKIEYIDFKQLKQQ